MIKRDKQVHPIYNIWYNIINSRLNPDSMCYKNYGGRGITIYEEWMPRKTDKELKVLDEGFLNFYNYVIMKLGQRPKGCSLDRIDNNKGYVPDNLRWADKYTQNNNKRCNIIVLYKDKRLTLKQWSRFLGLSYSGLTQRYNRGITSPDKLFLPFDNQKFKPKIFKYNNEQLTIREISNRTGLCISTIWGRIRSGWTMQEILDTKLK